VLHIGLDTHKEFIQACFVNDEGKKIKEERYPNTPIGLNKLCTAAQNGKCVLEASTSCITVYDALQAHGIRVRAANPLKIKAIASAKLKTDKVDAHMLAQLERADLIPEAHLPDKFTREMRELVRQHVSITNERTDIKNQIHALLAKNGIRLPFKSTFTQKSQSWLSKNTAGVAKLALEQTFQRIHLLNQQREVIDAEIERQAQNNPDAVLLKTIPGLGWFSAFLLAVEIDGVERFVDEEHLQSYAGLVPSVRQSGNTTRVGHISKQGNRLIRWVLVQDAWMAIRRSKRYKKKYTRMVRRHKKKTVAILAVARKILRDAFFMLQRRQAFNENA